MHSTVGTSKGPVESKPRPQFTTKVLIPEARFPDAVLVPLCTRTLLEPVSGDPFVERSPLASRFSFDYTVPSTVRSHDSTGPCTRSEARSVGGKYWDEELCT